MSIEKILKEAVKAIDDKKAKDIAVLNVEGVSSVTDRFVICTGNSTTQTKAIADGIEKELKDKLGIFALRTEGYQQGHWILLDYNTVVIHIFMPEEREFYDLERLWGDTKSVNIDEILGE